MDTSDSKRLSRHGGGLATGLIVVAIGVIFLLRNFGIELPFMAFHNWWALFILVAALGPLLEATHQFRRSGKMDGAVLHHLVSAAAIVTVALVFLMRLSWNLWWPVFIVFGGLWMLAKHWDGPADPPT